MVLGRLLCGSDGRAGVAQLPFWWCAPGTSRDPTAAPGCSLFSLGRGRGGALMSPAPWKVAWQLVVATQDGACRWLCPVTGHRSLGPWCFRRSWSGSGAQAAAVASGCGGPLEGVPLAPAGWWEPWRRPLSGLGARRGGARPASRPAQEPAGSYSLRPAAARGQGESSFK